CSVILNNRLVPSCLVLAAEAEGQSIETIEGVAQGSALHPLQKAFLQQAALQCGVCTPGFIVAAKALLDVNDSPTEEQVRYWLAGNLCAGDKAMYHGHAAAAVAATTLGAGRAAAALVKVDYDVRPPVLSVDRAMDPDAPSLHEDMVTQARPPVERKGPTNIAGRME